MERRLAAILFTDMVGYSRLTGLDEEGTIARQKVHRHEIFDPKIARYGGRVVKTTGDGLLVEFPSAVDAVKCAVEVQTDLSGYDADAPEDMRPQYRIGVNLGDILIEGDDILGDGVNIAARLEGFADPGGVAISDQVYFSLDKNTRRDFHDCGDHILKNISRSVQIWHWPKTTTKQAKRPEPDNEDGDLPNSAGADKTPISAVPDKPSIAVLPFDNMSADPDQEYLADGIAEDIITELSRLRGFFVIARNSSFTYKGKTFSISDVVRELGVHYVLKGSVRQAGNRIRVTAQLIEGIGGTHIWAERYDCTLDDIFELQDEITRQIVGALEPNLLVAEAVRTSRQLPESIDAWGFVAKATPLICALTQDDYEAGAVLLEKAIEIDPGYARAHGLLAVGLVTTAWMIGEDRSREALDKALLSVKLDPQDPWGHFALGLAFGFRRRSNDAIAAMQEALKLNPNFALARGFYGLVLAWAGFGEQALAELDKAERLSPRDALNFHYPNNRSVAFFASSNYEAAAEQARQGLRLRTDSTGPHRILAASCGQLRRIDEARSTVERLLRLHPDLTLHWARNNIPITDADFLDRYIEGLRLAGIPES